MIGTNILWSQSDISCECRLLTLGFTSVHVIIRQILLAECYSFVHTDIWVQTPVLTPLLPSPTRLSENNEWQKVNLPFDTTQKMISPQPWCLSGKADNIVTILWINVLVYGQQQQTNVADDQCTLEADVSLIRSSWKSSTDARLWDSSFFKLQNRPGYRFTKALTQIVKLRNYFLL